MGARVTHTGFATTHHQIPHPHHLQILIDKIGPAGWPLATAWFPEEGSTLAEAIRKGTAIGVSDGSYKPNQATHLASAGWIVQDLHTKKHIGGVLRVSGNPKETNAYRAELQGLHAMLMAITILCEFHWITQGSLVLGLDNEKGVSTSLNTYLDPQANIKHVDLIRAIRRLISEIPICIHLEHVRGHQDTKTTRTLNPLENLNVIADHMAKAHLDELIQKDQEGTLGPCPDQIYKEGTRIMVMGKKVTSDPGTLVRHSVFANSMQHHLQEKGLLSNTAFTYVDWDAIRSASKTAAPLFRLWAVKNASGQCAVGKCMERWGFWENARCKLCLAPEETARHVALCPSECTRTAFQEGLTKFEQKLHLLNTHPDILHCLLNGIRYRNQSFTIYSSTATTQAAQEQDEIGWSATLEGRISASWMNTQGQHYRDIASKKGPETWAAETVTAIWELTHHIWKTRCTIIKDMERAEETDTLCQALDDRIRESYAQYDPEEYAPEDHYLFTDKTLQARLTSSRTEKETWIQAIEWAHEMAEEVNNNENTQMRNSITEWLQTAT